MKIKTITESFANAYCASADGYLIIHDVTTNAVDLKVEEDRIISRGSIGQERYSMTENDVITITYKEEV